MRLHTVEDVQSLDQAAWERYMAEEISHISDDRRNAVEWYHIKRAVSEADGLPASSRTGSTTQEKISNRHYVPHKTILLALTLYLTEQQKAHTLRDIGHALERTIWCLYGDDRCENFSYEMLRAPGPCPVYYCPQCQHHEQCARCYQCPHKPPCETCPARRRLPEESSNEGCSHCATWAIVEKVKTKKLTMAWISWALAIICDYPGNIYRGRGTGDGAGNLVDVPLGIGPLDSSPWNQPQTEELRRVLAQSARVRRGASNLHKVLRSSSQGTNREELSENLRGQVDEEGRPDHPHGVPGELRNAHWPQGLPLAGVQLERVGLSSSGVLYVDRNMALARPAYIEFQLPEFIYDWWLHTLAYKPSLQESNAFISMARATLNEAEGHLGRPLNEQEIHEVLQLPLPPRGVFTITPSR